MVKEPSPVSKENRRTIILGLDGATFDVLNPLIDSGRMPVLKSIMDKGSHAPLRSTIHPLTAPAWSSFLTGVNQGKHGLYDFLERVPGTYNVRLVNAATRKRTSFLAMAGAEGRKVIGFNIPTSYPPEKVNGIIVGGMLSPSNSSKYTYPESIAGELDKVTGGYMIGANYDMKSSDPMGDYCRKLNAQIDNRTAALKHLLTKHEWDICSAVYTVSDRVSHAFWKYRDIDGHKYQNFLDEIYIRLDSALAEILEIIGPETDLMIMSDHGMGPLRKIVRLNKWLSDNGYLRFAELGAAQRLKQRTMESTIWFLKKIFKQNMREKIRHSLPGLRNNVESSLFSTSYDWNKTAAYSVGTYGNIFINMAGREPQGIVSPGAEYKKACQNIIEGLSQLIDPETGGKVVDRVWHKEELYSGPYLDRAPDLIVQWKNYEYYSVERFTPETDNLFDPHPCFEFSDLEITASHRMDGIFIASGPSFNSRTEVKEPRIIDLMPTLLYLQGIPIPEDTDGRVLIEIIDPELLKKKEILHHETPVNVDSEYVAYGNKESSEIADRLKGLGYFE